MQMEQGLVVLGVQGNEYRIDVLWWDVCWNIPCNDDTKCSYD